MRQFLRTLFACGILFLAEQTGTTHGWTWQCVDKKCIRGESPSELSLEVCRLTCGQYGSLWPQPTGHTAISDTVLGFDPSRVGFDFSAVTDYQRPSVRNFVNSISHLWTDKVRQLCRGECEAVPGTSLAVYIATSSSDLSLTWFTDESYTLEVSNEYNAVTARIRAETVYGARHGLETLSQLVTCTLSNNQLVLVTNAKVNDKPAYPHRGLLLDTARNYLPMGAIERQIDAMAISKMNVLHWHATDSQSFPLLLPRVPQLARFGAYSESEVYTTEDTKALITYARVRGVRILLELDMPAHAGNGWQWGGAAGLGSLAVCVNQQPWKHYCGQPPCGQLNPANPHLYKTLRDVFRDIRDTFPSGEAIHMGGDEVFFPCWKQSKEVTDWMKSQGRGVSDSDFLDVWGDFQKKVLQIWDEEVDNITTPILLWTSHLTRADIISKYLDKDRFVIEAWTIASDPLPKKLLEMGYRIIMATEDAWYLDHGFWGPTRYHNWRVVYDNRLPQGSGVLGGEVAMWGELVDENNLDSRVWPRAAAAAERMWTDPSSGNTAAEYRLISLRARLVQLGLQPEAISPRWCAENEGLCANSGNTS